jgi:hypothetical protein
MKQYSLKKINNSDIKYFIISLGLLPGYDTNKAFYTQEKVVGLYTKWIQKRLENNQIIFPGKLIPIEFIYGFKNDKKNIICNSENAIEIQGEIIRSHCKDIFDDNDILLKIVVELATMLGNEIQQERVHITFNNQKYILE